VKKKLTKNQKNHWKTGLIVFGVIAIIAGGSFAAYYFLLSETGIIVIKPDLPAAYNKEKQWDHVPIHMYVENDLVYNYAVIIGLAFIIYEDNGGSIGDFVESGTTDVNGKAACTKEVYSSLDYYWVVLGSIATTNKSQTFKFIVQGQDGTAQPSSIYCGTLRYSPVAEEAAITLAYLDEDFASLSTINLTDSKYVGDHKVPVKLRATFSTSGQCLGLDAWSDILGYAQFYIAVIVTEKNCTASTAVDMTQTSGYITQGSPTSKAVFILHLDYMSYEVDSAGNEKIGHENDHYINTIVDFAACGIPTTYTAATTHQFDFQMIIGMHYNAYNFANSGSPYSSTWFSDAGSTITVTT